MGTHLIIKAAATFLTLGHLTNANIVSKLPNIPTNIISIVETAAKVSKDRENLHKNEKLKYEKKITENFSLTC